MKIFLILLLSFSVLPIFAQNATFDEQLLSSEEYAELIKRLELLESQPVFDEQLLVNEEYKKIIERLNILENQTHFHTSPIIGYIGIIVSLAGFILMLRYWHDPFERHLEEWIKLIKLIYPNSYETRIKRDFNYWRNYKNKDEPSPDGEWYIPKDFARDWKNLKLLALFLVIGGFLLQIIQFGFL